MGERAIPCGHSCRHGYTVRVRPRHPDAIAPALTELVRRASGEAIVAPALAAAGLLTATGDQRSPVAMLASFPEGSKRLRYRSVSPQSLHRKRA